MTKYAVMDEVFDIMTAGAFERLTERQLIDAYFRSSERDAQIINLFDSEEDAVNGLDKTELCHTKEINFHQGLVHIAFVQRVDVADGREIVGEGEILKAKVGI